MNEEKTVGELALPPATAERLEVEALVEAFVGTDGLGNSRLRGLVDSLRGSNESLFPTTMGLGEFGIGELLRLLARQAPSPFARRSPRRASWESLSAIFQRAVQSGVPARSRWWLPGDPGWEESFGDDDEAPGALSICGSLAGLGAPRVAIVGTRSASAAGLAFARTLGAELADSGVSVVSGLARGIDGAAHRGVLSRSVTEPSGPVAVLGTGVGVVYPSEHRSLQHEISVRGLLLSEYEPTRGPRSEAFPQRNRIVAQLAQVVVVVESGAGGGSLITVNEAGLRNRPVLAVPSNPLVRSAEGTNDLLRGHGDHGPLALPCHGVADVLALLDVQRADGERFVDDRLTPNRGQLEVLNAIGWDRRSTSSLATELTQPLVALVRSLNELETLGWVHHVDGRWARKTV